MTDTKSNFWRNNLLTFAIHAVVVIPFIPALIIGSIMAQIATIGVQGDEAAMAAEAAIMEPFIMLILVFSFIAYVVLGYFLLKPSQKHRVVDVSLLVFIFLGFAGIYYGLSFIATGAFRAYPLDGFGGGIHLDILNIFPLINMQANSAVTQILFGQHWTYYSDYTYQQHSISMLIAAPIPSLLMYLGSATKNMAGKGVQQWTSSTK